MLMGHQGCWKWPLPGVSELDISLGLLCEGVGVGLSEGPTTVGWQAWP